MHWEVWHGLGCTCEKMCQDVARYNELRDDVLSWNGASHIPLILLRSVFFFQICYFVSGARDSWCLTLFTFPAGLTRCLQFKLVSDGSAIPSTGIFPFPLQNGQVPEKKTGEVWLVIWGPDCRSGEVADLQAQYVPIFFFQTVRVALVLGLQITLGKGSFHPQPPWIHVPAVSFPEDILRISFKLPKCINQ